MHLGYDKGVIYYIRVYGYGILRSWSNYATPTKAFRRVSYKALTGCHAVFVRVASTAARSASIRVARRLTSRVS